MHLERIFGRIKYVCLLMYVLSSCTNQNEIFNGNIVNLSLEKIRMEPMLGKPYQIATIDSFLIIADNVDGKGLLIYNLVDSSYSRKFDIGQGPNDIIPPIDLDTYADEIVMLQRRTVSIYVINQIIYIIILTYSCTSLKHYNFICICI